MDKKQLTKKLNGYITAFVLSVLALYFIGKVRDNVIASGGTDHTTASILVGLNAFFVFFAIFVAVMGFRTKSKLKKLQ